jgi:uncharacterized protein (TIGR03435 family)
MRRVATAGLIIAASQLVFAGAAEAPLTFEVASVKAAEPPTDGRIMVRMGGDPGRIDYTNVSLMNVITNAFKIKEHQVSGPGWLSSQRFNITAKLPAGATREQVPEMLQTLLKDRFKLAYHKESKVMPAYALVAAKGGPKLHEAEGVEVKAGGMPGGGMRMMMGPRGRHMSGKISIQQLADSLGNWLDRPVINETGITGVFDIDLEWSGDEGPQSMRAMRGPGGPGGGDGGPRPEGAPRPEFHDESADAPSIFTSLQDKLGLRLDPRKAPVDIFVIDNAEKVPTEN